MSEQRPDSVDFMTWGLLALLLSHHADGAVGGLAIVTAAVFLIQSFVLERRERKRRTEAVR